MSALAPLAAGLVAAGLAFGLVVALDDEAEPETRTAARATTAASVDGRSVFARMGCGGCHTFADAQSQGQIGPNLDKALAGYDAAALKEQIVKPRGSEGEMPFMPRNFEERMTAEELSALVTYLLENR